MTALVNLRLAPLLLSSLTFALQSSGEKWTSASGGAGGATTGDETKAGWRTTRKLQTARAAPPKMGGHPKRAPYFSLLLRQNTPTFFLFFQTPISFALDFFLPCYFLDCLATVVFCGYFCNSLRVLALSSHNHIAQVGHLPKMSANDLACKHTFCCVNR